MFGTVAEDSKDVLDKIKAEGTFDQMRVQVTETVKRTDTLTSRVQQLVANSDVFKSGKAENMSRKELFDNIRKLHEKDFLEIAAAATWEVLMNDSYGISQQIEQSTHQALCAVYEAREQQRLALHHQQQQQYQVTMEQYKAYCGSQPGQAPSYQQ
ncbi:hypothetical protein ABBQ32_004238 [Trebouxia sp. C0010 RCD-2024]